MNKTLLLIICDFLLLNLLALTRWDKLEQVESRQAPIPSPAANATRAAEEDLLTAMRIALEDERANRGKLSEKLQAESEARSAATNQLEQQRRQADSASLEAKQKALELQQRLEISSTQAAQTREKLGQVQTALAARQAESERQQRVLAESIRAAEAEKKKLLETLAQQQIEIQRQRESASDAQNKMRVAEKQASELNTAVRVAESERNLLRGNVDDLKQEVAIVRVEKDTIQTQAATLASGVSQLAARSEEITREIRENNPINANLMFSEFLSNRVQTVVSAVAAGLFSEAVRQKDANTVLVSDGTRTVAILPVSETPFNLAIPATGSDQINTRVSYFGRPMTTKGPLYFLAADQRAVALPVEAASQGPTPKIYPLSRNPFRFAEAVLISRGGRYYGEVEFKLDPRLPEYVKMKSRVLSRVFGEFSPSTGDLVLSKTGEFLGIMVNQDYCLVVKNLDAAEGGVFDPKQTRELTRAKLEGFRARLDRLPLPLR